MVFCFAVYGFFLSLLSYPLGGPKTQGSSIIFRPATINVTRLFITLTNQHDVAPNGDRKLVDMEKSPRHLT